ncbi:endolytic transglycosylase MltG [Ideonella sp. BN130291]|uniref:endolytic transglycosylase MltG n=1 Tax=Ideonella sp. BN130291 TaxID=3112940 RepID=UPI002E26144C|nr:endolytic transglycosylase MltG [Ideonella sp. BN130291]
MRLLRWMLVLLLLAALALGGSIAWWINHPLPLAGPTAEVSIEPGTPPRDIAQAWVQAGVQTSPLWLYEWFRWSGQARRIRAGSYVAGPGTTPYQLLQKMVQGEETLEHVRLIEGWTFRQWRAELAKAKSLKQTSAGMNDAQIMQALGSPGVSPEGRFFPDTYAYSKGVSDLTVMRRAHQALQRRLQQAWEQRAADTPLKSMDDALVLASIVEKETGASTDRGMVAGVFCNRLRLGMPLQTDPSVIYGLGERFDGNLRKKDLLTDGPYNTYTRAGLPPTPIAMPGMASLRAAVKPDVTKALYFVARGDGSSHFSENLAEHNRAVDKYQRAASR